MPPRQKPPRWVKSIVAGRYWLLAIAAILYVAARLIGGQPVLDRSIENMFAPDDPILVPYRRLQRTFGEHEVVLAVYSDTKLKSSQGVDRAAKLSEKLRAVPGVVATVSLADPPGAADFDDTGRGAQFRAAFAGYTHNESLDAAGVICLIERPGPGKPPRRETLAGMRRIVKLYPSGALVGEPVLIEQAFDLLDADGRRLNRWCTVFVLIAIYICFRRVRWLLLPLAAVQLAIAMTNGLLAVADLKLSMVSSMLSAIITVVGVATVVHLMVHYLDERRHGRSKRRALENTLAELWLPVAVAVFTDSAGFASLMASRVGPVHDFGLMAGIGSLLVLPAAFLLTPGLLYLGSNERDAVRTLDDDRMHAWLGRLLGWSLAHGRAIVLAGVLLGVLGLIGSWRMKRDTDFTHNFRDSSEIVQAYDFVETRFGGAGVWDLLVPMPKALTAADQAKVFKLERTIEQAAPELTSVMSLADVLAAGLGGPRQLERVPPFALRIALSTIRARMHAFIETMYRADPDDGRQWQHVMLRAPERLSAEEKSALIATVESTARKLYPGAQATGYYVLLASLIESILADQWKAFLIAATIIFAMMLAAIRDLKLTVVTLLPNLLPSVVLFGAMGWLGVPVNMGVAMIAAVSVGLSVDGSTHYAMHYQRRRARGRNRDQALGDAQSSVGRAAVFAAVALMAGFTTLGTSDFVPTVYFGALVSLSMLGGLIGNVVALPVLIRMVESANVE